MTDNSTKKGPEQKITSVRDLIKSAKPVIKRVPVCLRGDLSERYEELLEDLNKVREEVRNKERAATLAGNAEEKELKKVETPILDELEKITQEIKENTIIMKLKALDFKTHNDLQLKWTDADTDKVDEHNLIADVMSLTIVEPFTVTPEEWKELQQVMSAGQTMELTNAAQTVSVEKVIIPLS